MLGEQDQPLGLGHHSPRGKSWPELDPKKLSFLKKLVFLISTLPRGDGTQEKRAFSHFLFLLFPRVGGAELEEIDLSQKELADAM